MRVCYIEYRVQVIAYRFQTKYWWGLQSGGVSVGLGLMKNIDIKSLIIGALFTSTIFLGVAAAGQISDPKVENVSEDFPAKAFQQSLVITDKANIQRSPIRGFIMIKGLGFEPRHLPVSEIVTINEWDFGFNIGFAPRPSNVGYYKQAVRVDPKAMSAKEMYALINSCLAHQ